MASKSNYLDNNGVSYLWEKVKKYIANKDIRTATPVGGSIDWYGPESTIPSDWMREDGRSLSKTQYPELFAVIGYTYGGSGDDFNIPNSKGRVNVHLDENDNDFKILGNKYGWKTHQLIINQLPSHTHGKVTLKGALTARHFQNGNGDIVQASWISEKGIATGTNKTWSGRHAAVGANPVTETDPYVSEITIDASHEHLSVGSNEAHPNVQPSIISYKIIKVKEDAASRDLRLLDNEIISLDEKLSKIMPHYISMSCTRHVQTATTAWKWVQVNNFSQNAGAADNVLEVGTNSIKIKKDCYINVRAQGSLNIPTQCDLHLTVIRHTSTGTDIQWANHYSRSISWSPFNINAIGKCLAGDEIRLYFTVGIAGDYEFLDNTMVIVEVFRTE